MGFAFKSFQVVTVNSVWPFQFVPEFQAGGLDSGESMKKSYVDVEVEWLIEWWIECLIINQERSFLPFCRLYS